MEKNGIEAPLNMLALQRRRKILDLLQEEGSARVSALSRLFKVSEPTVRQDLEKLEEEGHIIREHGGAFLKSVPQQVKSLSLQHMENMDKNLFSAGQRLDISPHPARPERSIQTSQEAFSRNAQQAQCLLL